MKPEERTKGILNSVIFSLSWNITLTQYCYAKDLTYKKCREFMDAYIMVRCFCCTDIRWVAKFAIEMNRVIPYPLPLDELYGKIKAINLLTVEFDPDKIKQLFQIEDETYELFNRMALKDAEMYLEEGNGWKNDEYLMIMGEVQVSWEDANTIYDEAGIPHVVTLEELFEEERLRNRKDGSAVNDGSI